MNYYIVTFDRKIGVSYRSFHEEFVNNPEFLRWFHYIKSSYIIGTLLTAQEVSAHFKYVAQNKGLPTTHLVVAVNLDDRQGMLTKDAWTWIKENS